MTAELAEKLDTLDFHAFQQFRREVLAADPSIIDCSETNLWRSLSTLLPKVPEHAAETVHRCHLAQQWLNAWSLPDEWAPRALVSSGVRHSLSLIFAQLAANHIPLILPADVYPVYGELARAANLPFQTFTTLNGKNSFQLPDSNGWLVLPSPLKPAGRDFSNAERLAIREWLAADASRRVVFDVVYTFDKMLDCDVLEFAFKTQQVIMLHSLSKSWLLPKVFGVALIPEADRDLLTATFRANSPTQLELTQARHVMSKYPRLPVQIFGELRFRREQLLARLPAAVQSQFHSPPSAAHHVGYLLAVEASASRLLAEHRLLAIPASVFGSVRTDCSIVSAL